MKSIAIPLLTLLAFMACSGVDFTSHFRGLLSPCRNFVFCEIWVTYLTFIGPCIVIYFYSKTNSIHKCLKIILFGVTLYMFRTVSPPIIRSSQLCTQSNKNPSTWNFLSPELEVTWRTAVVIIRVLLLSPYLCIRGVSPSSIHYNQSYRIYINRRQQYICLIWN